MKTSVWLDATQLSGQSAWSGIGTYVRELTERLGARPDVRVTAIATDDVELPEGVARRTVTRRIREGRPSVVEHETRRAFELMARGNAVFHNPNPHAPLVCRSPWVQTLHDLIPLVYDDPALAGLKSRFLRFGPRYRRADAVIAVSRHAADEGMRVWGLDPRRIEVVHHGVAAQFVPGDGTEQEPGYISVVSEFSRRKGFDLAFEVIASLAQEGYPQHLVVAGRIQEWLREDFDLVLASASRPDRIEVRGFVDDLAAVYQGATVHLVTSRYEGFGFPALEAMACGTPVVAFANSSLPEVIGDAGILVPDGDVGAMVAAVRRLLHDPSMRADLAHAGVERARQFTWAESASRHAEVYFKVAGSG